MCLIVGIQFGLGVVGQSVEVGLAILAGQHGVFQTVAEGLFGHEAAKHLLQIGAAVKVITVGQIGLNCAVQRFHLCFNVGLARFGQGVAGFFCGGAHSVLFTQVIQGAVQEIIMVGLAYIGFIQRIAIHVPLFDVNSLNDLILGGFARRIGHSQTDLRIVGGDVGQFVVVIVKGNLGGGDLLAVDGGHGGIALEYAGVPDQQNGDQNDHDHADNGVDNGVALALLCLDQFFLFACRELGSLSELTLLLLAGCAHVGSVLSCVLEQRL